MLASYAADAAVDVEGVHGLVDGPRRQSGVRVSETEGAVGVEVHIALDWGARGPDVGAEVQRRVDEYLTRTAQLPTVAVDVVIATVAASAR